MGGNIIIDLHSYSAFSTLLSMFHWCTSATDNVESDKNLQICKDDCLLFLLLFFFFEILLHLPYSRKLEEEADEVGMNMAAKVRKLTFFLFFNLF